ncbi:hypothetical protein Agub_g8142, partial [Astrephomene gubernaculifera]
YKVEHIATSDTLVSLARRKALLDVCPKAIQQTEIANMCNWYCTSSGPSTNLKCLHCGKKYCAACLHGEFQGKMPSLVKCGACGKNPRSKPNSDRGDWSGTKVPGRSTGNTGN